MIVRVVACSASWLSWQIPLLPVLDLRKPTEVIATPIVQLVKSSAEYLL